MSGDTVVGPLEKTNCVVQRAFTWEISDSEVDSDVEPCKMNAGHQPAADWDCAGKDVGAGESSEGLPLQGSSSPLSIKKKRKKRSPEEMEAERAKLEARKLERELRREERMRRREQMALEKQRRKEVAAALKLLQPDQCVKRLTVCVDPCILEDPGSDAFLEALGSLGCQSRLEAQAVPRTVTWKRGASSGALSADEPPGQAEEEREALLLLEPGVFLKRLFSLLQSTSQAGQPSALDLSQLLSPRGPEGHSAKAYDVVVIGLEAYQWYSWHHGEALNIRSEEQGSDKGSHPGPELSMSQQQIEEALVILQLWGNAGVLFLESWTELAQHVSAMTRAIARRMYKKHSGSQPFSFCSTGKWASGIRVGEDGTGLREAWCRQIQQFNRVSPAVAEAVTRAYPSPCLLLQAYEQCGTDKDRELLLSDIRLEAEKSQRARRIGPDLSRKIYLFLVATNPELVLDWTA